VTRIALYARHRHRPLAYYRARPDEQFWSSHWQQQSLDDLLEVAEHSPLTRFLERYLAPGERVLEGGCGLGQYVLYFRRRGVEMIGVDFSSDAVARHLAIQPQSEVHVADLTQLPFADETFDAYVSLGVVEHYADGGQSVLSEAHRVLRPGGRLLLSTPYLNLSRRLLRPVVERQQRTLAESGCDFYQYAFSSRTLDRILANAFFTVTERSYYDPWRGVRDLSALLPSLREPARASKSETGQRGGRRRGRFARRILDATPTLLAFAHMQIVSARKTAG
jgi:SAM-dependent methyltransferase